MTSDTKVTSVQQSSVAEMGDRFSTVDMRCGLRTQAGNKHTMVSYM